MKSLDQLLSESKTVVKLEKPRNNFIRTDPNPPDAVVLVQVNITCKWCSSKYTYPNIHLLIRRGRQRLRIKQWANSYYALPREIFEVEESSDVCQNCFHSDRLVIGDETVSLENGSDSI